MRRHTHTISLVPKGKINKALPEQLTITASLLTDSLGRPIDGNHDGQPGGDFVATLKGKSVTILSTGVVRATSASQRALEAIDRVLAGHKQLLRSPARSLHTHRKPHGVTDESQPVKVVLPAPKVFMVGSVWLHCVIAMKNGLLQNVSGALPHRIVAIETTRPLQRG